MLGVTHGSGFMSGADRQRFRIVVSSPTLDFVLTDRLNALGWDGREVDVDILVATNEGDVYPIGVPDPANDLWETYTGAWIGSSSTSTAALLLDTLPVGSAVTIDNRGFICGRGGDGGAGGIPGVGSGLGGNGGDGGPAIEVDSANWYSVTIVNRGFIGGGGGGGGGGTTYDAGTDRGAGGGPGGGLPAGNVGTTTNRSDYFNGYRRGSFPYGGCGGGLRSEPGSTGLWAQSSSGGNGGAVGEDGMDQSASPASVANPGQGLGGAAGAAIVDPSNQVTLIIPGNVPGTGGIVWGPGTPPDPSNYVWGSSAPVCQVRGPGLPFAYDGDVQVVMANGELKKMKDLVIGDEVATFTPNIIIATLVSGNNIMDEDNASYYDIPYTNVGDILDVPPNEYLGIFRSKAVVVSNPPYTLTTVLDRFDVKAIEGTTFTTPLSGALVSWHGRVLCGDPSGTVNWDFTNVSYANKRILFRSRTGVANPDTGAPIPPQATHPALTPGERRFVKATTGTCSPTASGTYTVYSPMLGATEEAGVSGLVIAAAYTASTPAGTEERSMLVLARGNKVMPPPVSVPPPTSTWPEWKAGTMFTMADGTTKNVSALVAGDLLRCVSGHPVLHGKLKRSDFYDMLGSGRFDGYTAGSYGMPGWKRTQTTVTTSTVRVKRCVPARIITAPLPALGSLPSRWPLASQNSDELFYNPDGMFFVTMRGGSGVAGIFTPTDRFNIERVGITLDGFPGNTWYGQGWRPGNGTGVAILRHRAADPYRPQLTNATNNSSYCSALTTVQDADAAGQTYYLELEATGPTSCAVIIANGYYVVNVENDNLFVVI